MPGRCPVGRGELLVERGATHHEFTNAVWLKLGCRPADKVADKGVEKVSQQKDAGARCYQGGTKDPPIGFIAPPLRGNERRTHYAQE